MSWCNLPRKVKWVDAIWLELHCFRARRADLKIALPSLAAVMSVARRSGGVTMGCTWNENLRATNCYHILAPHLWGD